MVNNIKELQIELFGRVQGIGFRYTIRQYAQQNNLNGYVANQDDGSVKALVQGTKEQLDKFIEWIKKSPGFSRVIDMKYEINKAEKKYEDFTIEHQYNLFEDKSRSFINLSKSFFKQDGD